MVSDILYSFMMEGGGDRDVLSALCFRKGCAIYAIAYEINPNKILHLGRWASATVFHRN